MGRSNGASHTNASYEISDRADGRMLLVTGRWTDEAAAAIEAADVDGLILSYEAGFREPDLEFIQPGWKLRRLMIIERHRISDLSPIERLSELERLELHTARDVPVDLEALPRLSVLEANWLQVRETLGEAKSLERLTLWNFDEVDLTPFSGLNSLTELRFSGGTPQLRSLEGIPESLSVLSVYSAPVLDDISGVTAARSTLRELDFESCRGISSIAPISELTQLRYVGFNECGMIDTLQPLSRLRELERLAAWGSTRIADDDLSPLLELPKLTEIRMVDRRDYRPRVKALPGIP